MCHFFVATVVIMVWASLNVLIKPTSTWKKFIATKQTATKRKKMLRVFIIKTVLSDTDNLQLLETVITLASKKRGLRKKMLKKAERRGSKVEGAASFWNVNTTVSQDFTSAHTCLRHPTL